MTEIIFDLQSVDHNNMTIELNRYLSQKRIEQYRATGKALKNNSHLALAAMAAQFHIGDWLYIHGDHRLFEIRVLLTDPDDSVAYLQEVSSKNGILITIEGLIHQFSHFVIVA